MTYSTLTTEQPFGTVCIAYPDKFGVDTLDGLNNYEGDSQGTVELIFVDSKQEAKGLLKSFNQ